MYNTGTQAARKFLEGDTPIWYILGSGTNLGQLNVASNVVKVTSRGGQTDQVFPVFNNNFNLFRFEDANRTLLQKMPPVTVPFGDFRLTPNSEVILYQKVGTLTTDKPLLVVNHDKVRKSAILLGEGLGSGAWKNTTSPTTTWPWTNSSPSWCSTSPQRKTSGGCACTRSPTSSWTPSGSCSRPRRTTTSTKKSTTRRLPWM
jgi:hypothetical protein